MQIQIQTDIAYGSTDDVVGLLESAAKHPQCNSVDCSHFLQLASAISGMNATLQDAAKTLSAFAESTGSDERLSLGQISFAIVILEPKDMKGEDDED